MLLDVLISCSMLWNDKIMNGAELEVFSHS
jgi:hypothetical protein